MSIKLPRDMRGYNFDKLFSIEMNDFVVDALLPSVFYLIRSKGKRRGRRNDATQIEQHREAFTQHPNVIGFDDPDGRTLADKWIRTSFIQTARVGRGRQQGEQILFVRPLSFLAYKPGFPTEVRRLRGVPQFIYAVLRRRLGDHRRGSTLLDLENIIRNAFARGVELPESGELDGRYNGKTPLDTEVLALLYYLDTFEPCPSSTRRVEEPSPPCLPTAAEILFRDLALFLLIYHQRVPSSVLGRYVTALLNFELAIYTLKLVEATNFLFDTGACPREMLPIERTTEELTTDIRFYVDLTGDDGSASSAIAYACLNRDLEALHRFITARIFLRTLDRYVQSNADLRKALPEYPVSAYLEALMGAWKHPDISADARSELRRVRDDNSGDDETGEAVPPELEEIIRDETLDDVAKVTRIVELASGKNPIQGAIKWYSSVFGLTRDDGLIDGNTKGRRVWRYRMSDRLLEVLVQLCTVLPDYNGVNRVASLKDLEPRSVPLFRFIEFLRNRYGILVDSPPDWMQSTETINGARENVEALKHRLRHMGFLDDLSDDFNAQWIRPRFREIRGDLA